MVFTAAVINAAGKRRRQLASIVRKERREALVRTKRFRTATATEGGFDEETAEFVDVEIKDCDEILEDKTKKAVEKLRTAVTDK